MAEIKEILEQFSKEEQEQLNNMALLMRDKFYELGDAISSIAENPLAIALGIDAQLNMNTGVVEGTNKVFAKMSFDITIPRPLF